MDPSARGNFLAQKCVDAHQREEGPKGMGRNQCRRDEQVSPCLWVKSRVAVICAGTMVTLKTHREKSSSKGSVHSVQ